MGNGWIFVIVCVQIIILFMLYHIWKRAQIKSREGIKLPGKRLSYKEIPGQPKRYLLSVEYCIDVGAYGDVDSISSRAWMIPYVRQGWQRKMGMGL